MHFLLLAMMLGFVAGMNLSWTSPVLPKLEKSNSDNPLGTPITDSENSWIAGLLSLGATFGPFLAAFASEKIGRKWSLIIIDVPFIVCFLILAFGEAVWLYLVARFIVGLSIGGTFTVLPTYIAELSPDSLRGTMGGIMTTFIVTGVFMSYVIGPYISILWFNIVCAAIATGFAVVFFLFMPETPQYLVSNGRESEAKEILAKLRGSNVGNPDIDQEFMAVCDMIRENSGGSIKDLTSRGNMKGLIVAGSMLAFQQFSGINIVQFYAQQIFTDSGSSVPSEVSPMIVGGVQVIASFVTPILADKAGRKFLFVLSAAGMLISEVPLGVFFYLKDDHQNVDDILWLPVACLVGYIAMYNCGMGALPWTVMAEIFPPNIKGIASSISASICWFLSFLLTFFFSDISAEIGIGGSFWLFSAFNALAIVFVLTYVPETKGKSQKEIQQMLAG